MADHSNGPVRTMPGHRSATPQGQMCDEHPTVPAWVRIQGETDSFGCEYIDACRECDERIKLFTPLFDKGSCDLCQQFKDDLKNWRDLDEGAAGRIYRACGECRHKANQEALDDAQASDDNSIASMIQEHDPDPEDVLDAVSFDEEDGEDN